MPVTVSFPGVYIQELPSGVQEAPDRVPTEVREPGGNEYEVVESEDQAEANAEMLRQLYKMTPAEARLAVRITCGYSIQHAAAAQGLCISTVRTHLKRIFSKTNTHHQGALVTLLIVGPAQLRLRALSRRPRARLSRSRAPRRRWPARAQL